MIRTVSSLPELDILARDWAEQVRRKRVVLLNAPMGSGKTTWVSALMRALDATDEASSPTYSIVNEYELKDGQRVFHFDLYRLKDQQEVMQLGFWDYIDSGSICIIEWPDLIADILDMPHAEIRIRTEGEIRHFEWLEK